MTEGHLPTLVVFSDDWGRHPSSCQHLVRQLLASHEVVWVNTIGMRRMRLTTGDLRRAVERVMQWSDVQSAKPQTAEGAAPRVISPLMYPGFRRPWQRKVNAGRMAGAVNGKLRSRKRRGRVAVTTLPITADLVGKLEVDRWVYYCVDDFSVWPGLDGQVMDAMERDLVAKVDAVVCVSQVLRERVRTMGRESELLTHGVDLEHWHDGSPIPQVRAEHGGGAKLLFWGLLDDRMDWESLKCLADQDGIAEVVLAGPEAQPGTCAGSKLRKSGPVPYEQLPQFAASADVLIMPYIDAPVTRAMQPLKLLEYLATYKPVVVRDLPATREWADCCDVVATNEDFAAVCLERARTGLLPQQRAARERRLAGESWSEKARRFAVILHGKEGKCR